MGNMTKLVSLLFILNIFMYIGVNMSISADGEHQLNEDYNFRFNGDLIDTFMGGYGNLDTITEDTKQNWTSYGVEFNETFTKIPDQSTGVSTGVGGIQFLDSLRIVWSFILTLGNIISAPLTLFFNFRMPVMIGLMIGIPYFLILFIVIMGFIRGTGD